MGMPLELNTMIVTKDKERRVEDNLFELKKADYRVYPLHIPLEIKKFLESEIIGTAKIHSLTWKNNETIIEYELLSLSSPN